MPHRTLISRRFLGAALALALGLTLPAPAQNADYMVYSVGKTFTIGGETWAYLLWQPGDASTTLGRRFAVYRKDGDIASPNPYARLGIQTVQTSPAATKALLILGAKFDHTPNVVPGQINALYADATNQPDEVLPNPPTVPDNLIASQLNTMLQIAEADGKVLDRLMFLGRAHPGVMMCLGHGFAIKVANNSLHTYEVREIDAGDNDLRVLGRVTLDAAAPVVLTAPGRPYGVQHPIPEPSTQLVASPKDHLACRFRWGVPDDLRRLIPQTFGYNLYRVKESVATNLGWDLAAPDIADLEDLVALSSGPDPDAKRVNALPVLPPSLLTEAQASDPADHETFFTHDDNEPPDNRFVDGQTFYYYAAALDIAGHPGTASLGTRLSYCDRLPPPVPSIESIRNIFTNPNTDAELAGLKGTQHFRVRIEQLPETPAKDAASRYYIYRWTYAQQWITDGGNPATNLVGSVVHVPGEKFVDWNDTSPGAPKITPTDQSWFNKTVWYTVRAEDNTACSPKNLSGHSPPIFGVLRDRVGPGRPTGILQRCRAIVNISNSRPRGVFKREVGLDDDAVGFLVEVTRTDPLIQSFDVRVVFDNGLAPPTTLFATTRFFSTANVQLVHVPIPDVPSQEIQVRSRTQTNQVSPWSARSTGDAVETSAYINIYPFQTSLLARYSPTSGVPETPPEHEVDGPNGTIVGPNGTLTLPAGTREWRVYRKVGPEGEYQLIARGAGDSLPANVNWSDEAPPTVNGTIVCYYGQVFDEHGNSGPLTRIGCVKMITGKLPVPMLSPVELLASSGDQAQIKLKWFGDPVGVERFEIWCAADGSPDPGLVGAKISPKLGNADGLVISDEAVGLSFTAYQSPSIPGGFGSGAKFDLTLLVPANKLLHFAVRAVGSGDFATRPSGGFSNVVSGLWQEPAAPGQPVVPWPARPLPVINDLSFDIDDYLPGEGPFYAQPLQVGYGGSATIMVGKFKTYTSPDGAQTAFITKTTPPEDLFFKFRKQGVADLPDPAQLEPILPFVVYRHQVPSTLFPAAVPNLTQVSPLIDRIAYRTEASFYDVRDPFFLYPLSQNNSFGTEVPVSGIFQRDPASFTTQPWASVTTRPRYLGTCDGLILWVDHQPVTKGASYQYLLVHFTKRGEIERVIPTNTVDQ